MLEMKITVELPGIVDAMNHLADAIAGKNFTNANIPVVPVKVTPATVHQNTTAAEAPAPAPVAATTAAVQAEPVVPTTPATPVQNAPVAPSVPVENVPVSVAPAPVVAAPAPVSAPAEKPVTLHDLSIAGAKLVDQGKINSVIKLLQSFGVPAITELKEDQYAGFADGLRGLGAEV